MTGFPDRDDTFCNIKSDYQGYDVELRRLYMSKFVAMYHFVLYFLPFVVVFCKLLLKKPCTTKYNIKYHTGEQGFLLLCVANNNFN